MEPRSTSSHCGSENALDQRVPVLPSTASAAGSAAFSVRGRRRGLVQREVGRAAACRRRRRFPCRRPGTPTASSRTGWPARAVHPDVAAGAGDVQGLGAAGPGRGGVDRRPGRAVGRGLDLERRGVGGLPVQHDLADRPGWSRDRPRSHCGSENALDQRVPVLPSTASAAGVPAFSVEDAVAGLFSARFVVPQVPPPEPTVQLNDVDPMPRWRPWRSPSRRGAGGGRGAGDQAGEELIDRPAGGRWRCRSASGRRRVGGVDLQAGRGADGRSGCRG